MQTGDHLLHAGHMDAANLRGQVHLQPGRKRNQPFWQPDPDGFSADADLRQGQPKGRALLGDVNSFRQHPGMVLGGYGWFQISSSCFKEIYHC